MSTVANIRNIKLPRLSRASVVIGVLVVVLALAASVAGYRAYRALTVNTVTAYFSAALALYPGDKVQIQGVRVGSIDSIEPDDDKMKVVFHYDSQYVLPADVTASVLNPSLVASRTIQLAPRYSGGPQLEDDAVIPLQRTQVPVEWDDLREQISRLVTELGPTPEQPKGPIGEVVESFADGLSGKGRQLNDAFVSLSSALTALNEGRGDFFAIIRNLALFVNTLRANDQQFTALNRDLADVTTALNNSDDELGAGVRDFRALLATTRKLLEDNGEVATTDVNNLANTTNEILQPVPRNGLENALHVLPTYGANFANIYSAANGALTAVPVLNNFANPMQFLCSSIQAASRKGYQESAELCAQYLAPILDAIKGNFPPFGVQPFNTASVLPKHVAYSEDRLAPPPGFKDTTVPGLWSRDTLLSHGNREPGWVVAQGMQGIQVQPATERMLAPDSLAALLGGPDVPRPPDGVRGVGPPNAYDENNPLPPPWYPQPLPSPAANAPAPPLPAEGGAP